jgi:hypothetical protein
MGNWKTRKNIVRPVLSLWSSPSIGSKVLIAVVMKGSIFWDITSCSDISVDSQLTTRRCIPEDRKNSSSPAGVIRRKVELRRLCNRLDFFRVHHFVLFLWNFGEFLYIGIKLLPCVTGPTAFCWTFEVKFTEIIHNFLHSFGILFIVSYFSGRDEFPS